MKLQKKSLSDKERREALVKFIFKKTMEEAKINTSWQAQCLEGRRNWAYMVRALIRNKKEIIERVQNAVL